MQTSTIREYAYKTVLLNPHMSCIIIKLHLCKTACSKSVLQLFIPTSLPSTASYRSVSIIKQQLSGSVPRKVSLH